MPMILPCRESPMTRHGGLLEQWAVLGSGPAPSPAKATPRKARGTTFRTRVSLEPPFVCDAWHVTSRLRHNQPVTWALQRVDWQHCRMPCQRRPEPKPEGQGKAPRRLARHVTPCTPCVAMLTRAAVCREDGPAAMRFAAVCRTSIYSVSLPGNESECLDEGLWSVHIRASCVTPRPAGRQDMVHSGRGGHGLAGLSCAAGEPDVLRRRQGTQWEPRRRSKQETQVIVEDSLMRLAAVVSSHPPLDGVRRRKMGKITRWPMRPEVSSTCQLKSESG